MSAFECIKIIKQAGRDLSDDEIADIVERVQRRRDRLVAEGKLDGLDAQLRDFARQEGTKARVAAALMRKHAALNAIIRDRLERRIETHVANGLSHHKALLAVLEGTARGVADGRVSVASTRLAYEGKFLGGMMAAIQRDRPHILKMLEDREFLADVVREMFELRDGGAPGRSGNNDARFTAKTFATFAELSRTDMNRLGAAIGKLDGWAGPQVHDPHKLLGVTEDEWVERILPRLDQERTFGRDQGRLNALEQSRVATRADLDRAALDQREAAREVDEMDQRADRLKNRKRILAGRRKVAEARLEERQGEMGAQLERRLDVHERAAKPRPYQKGQAREQGVALNRLRRKGNQAHDLLGRIDEADVRADADLTAIAERRAAAEARRGAAETAHRNAMGRLARIELERGDLRPEVDDPVEFLRQAYRSIITGRDNTITAAEKGEYTGPANLARSLARHRVLHFKSADDWLAYNAEFGHGNVFSSMVAHQRRAARIASQMEVLGPNPETMLAGLVDNMARKIRNDPKIPDAEKAARIRALSIEGQGRVASALAEVRGLTLAPGNLTAARIGSTIRAVQSMAKLGAAVVSSISDVATSAANLTFHGQPIAKAWADQLVELTRGRGNKEAREIAFLIGEGFDGLIGQIITPHVAGDGTQGAMSRSMDLFFRLSGLTWWTDARRAGSARILSAHMGAQIEKRFSDLDRRFRHGLSLHGIGKAEWDVLRQARFRARNGNVYVTPDRIRDLADEAFAGLIPAEEIRLAREYFKLEETTMKQFQRTVPVPPEMAVARAERFAAWQARRINRARDDLEMALGRYFADETSFSVLETDDQTRRTMYWGTRAGTVPGEALRFVMQFKGFPLAFSNRILGRALRGGEGGGFAGARHLGHLIAGTLVAGYMAMTAKDILRGWWPPRDPKDPKALLAAMMQGGGAGIYGDFLFGQASRFGSRPLETLAGPSIGAAAGAVDLWQQALAGDARGRDGLRLLLQNTPFLNLWYVRPAMNFLVLDSLTEAINPGYLARQERRRRKEMRQKPLWERQ